MEQTIIELQKAVNNQTEKIIVIEQSIEKMRKYFLITAWVTVLAVLLPLLGIMIISPMFLSSYTELPISAE